MIIYTLSKEGVMSELREKIIQSSLQLFSEQGFHGVSVKDIVEHCQTSKGGFYHHSNQKMNCFMSFMIRLYPMC